MHNLDNDGFAVLTYNVIENKTLPALLFSGSYRKCLNFIGTAKTIVFHAGLVFCSAAEAKEYLKTWDFVKGGEKDVCNSRDLCNSNVYMGRQCNDR